MSKIKLTGNASGTGTLTIAAPNTNTDLTLTLPTEGDFVTSDASGNVGIGTSSPSDPLSLGAGLSASFNATSTGQTTRLRWRYSGSEQAWIERVNSVGALAFGNQGSERMRIDSSGNLLVGTTGTPASGSAGVRVYNNGGRGRIDIGKTATGTANGIANYHNGSYVGGVNFSDTATSFNTSSDYRLKTDVQPMTGATERLKQLKPVNFEWIADGSRVDGFLAHEAQEVVPEAVSGAKDAVQVWEEGEELPEGVAVGDNKLDEDGNTIPEYQGIDQSKMTPLVVKCLQEAIARIESLEAEVAALKGA